ncbi:MAG: FKBP-type peptidyl-prolyl cis-trans isomerase [Spirochaetaceae bacterium]|nr:FKBP-type peptidyl-prolyl cis-trans isomerase [Spirochaetaceae bacterium]
MKQLLWVAVVVLIFSCTKTPAQVTASKTSFESEGGDEEMSYAFGMIMASDFEELTLAFDYAAFAKGFKEQIEGNTTMTFDEALGIAQNAYSEAISVKNENTRQDGIAFLKENSTKEGVTVTESGLQYEVISEGSGRKPFPSETVRVHYEGTLIDGTPFDNSYGNGEPVEFSLDTIIPGWNEGLQLMNEGATYRFYIPSELAYGETGAGQGRIPPNSVLIFKIELLSIKPALPE